MLEAMLFHVITSRHEGVIVIVIVILDAIVNDEVVKVFRKENRSWDDGLLITEHS